MPVPITTECPADLEKEVQTILDAGATFEIEILSTDEVSMTVEFDSPDGTPYTWAIEVCKNNEEIDIYLPILIKRAYQRCEEFNRHMEGQN